MTEAVSILETPADLPLEVTTFVGRRSDLRRIRELMSESRLVTLTGFGGIGKTRLAMRIAAGLRRVFDDAHVVALGGVGDPEGVPEQFAAALGLHGRSTQAATIAAVEYLRPRTALLVLDNCEHVVEIAAVIADTLLRTCPGVHILATSREPLRTDGEAEYPVAALTFPGRGSGEEALHQHEAVQLYLDRDRAIVPDFALTDDNRAAVAAISRKLEGIPLTVELAVARLRFFSPTEFDALLGDRWELLGRGNRTAPCRHSTMAACIVWSFDLCTPSERLLWAKVAVLVDGFELDAAVAVSSEPDDDEPIEKTLALLVLLVGKSVLTSTRQPSANRYRMLGPIHTAVASRWRGSAQPPTCAAATRTSTSALPRVRTRTGSAPGKSTGSPGLVARPATSARRWNCVLWSQPVPTRAGAYIADTLGIAVLLETLAWIAVATDPERAATLLGPRRTSGTRSTPRPISFPGSTPRTASARAPPALGWAPRHSTVPLPMGGAWTGRPPSHSHSTNNPRPRPSRPPAQPVHRTLCSPVESPDRRTDPQGTQQQESSREPRHRPRAQPRTS
jgi:predicted ATPase